MIFEFSSNDSDVKQHDPDYVEKSFIDYFHDEMCKPIELIPETTTGQDRKLISLVTEIDYIKSLIQTYDLTVPIVIKNMLKYCEIDENYVENNIDYEDLRKELLLILFYSKTVPTNVTKSNIYSTIDETFQGKIPLFSLINYNCFLYFKILQAIVII